MSGLLPEIEFIVAWQNYPVGVRIRPNGFLRDTLVRGGFAKLVEPVTHKPKPHKPKPNRRKGIIS